MKYLEKYSRNIIDYQFEYEGDKYKVEFTDKIKYWELSYYKWDIDKWSVTKTGKGNPYKIVDIVMGDILGKFIHQFSPKKILIEGLPREREREYVSPRTKLYLRYLRKNPPSGMDIHPKGEPINNKILLYSI